MIQGATSFFSHPSASISPELLMVFVILPESCNDSIGVNYNERDTKSVTIIPSAIEEYANLYVLKGKIWQLRKTIPTYSLPWDQKLHRQLPLSSKKKDTGTWFTLHLPWEISAKVRVFWQSQSEFFPPLPVSKVSCLLPSP